MFGRPGKDVELLGGWACEVYLGFAISQNQTLCTSQPQQREKHTHMLLPLFVVYIVDARGIPYPFLSLNV